MTIGEDTIGAALRDFALDQVAQVDLELARAGAWQHSGVHLARKALARLRAVLALLRGSPLAQRALEAHLRHFAHGLSPLRDTQAALAAAKKLCNRGTPMSDTWRAHARELKTRRDSALGAALMADPGCAEHRHEVARVRAAIGAVAWTRLLAGDLQLALERSAKRARRACAAARASTAEAPRHQLRRRSRRVLLQIDVLWAIAKDEARPRSAATARTVLNHVFGGSKKRNRRKQVIDRLGWEQDLRVLRRALPAHVTTSVARRAIAAVRQELILAQAATSTYLQCS